MHELGSVTDELRSSRSGGGAIQASARRPMRSRSTRSVASLHVVHPPMAPVVAQRMGQVHGGPALLDYVGRPVPAIGRFQDHFWVLTGLGQLGCQGDGVVVDADRVECLTCLVAAHDHAASPMEVDADILLLLFHRESPSVVSGLVSSPQVCSAHLVPGDGRTPVGTSPWVPIGLGRRSSLPRERAPRARRPSPGDSAEARYAGTALRSFMTSSPQLLDFSGRERIEPRSRDGVLHRVCLWGPGVTSPKSRPCRV